jgi:hypothetical protein
MRAARLLPLVVLACSGQGSPASQAVPTAGSGAGGAAGSAGLAGSAGSALGAANQGGGATAGSAGAAVAGGGAAGSAGSGGSTALPFGHPDPSVQHPVYEGFTLWLVEDFTQPLDFASDPIWTYSDGGFQTHRFTPDAISFEPGRMVLTLSDQPQASSCSYSNTGVVPMRAKTSGELRSKHNWFRYGRYEVRFKAPSVKPDDVTTNGNYIMSLFTYRQPGCQEWREIDLEVTGDAPGHLGTNLITADQDCNFTADKEQPQFFDLPASFRTDFQTVGFEWLPGVVRFYYFDAGGQRVQLRELQSALVPDLSAKLMANLWVFDDSFAFGGPEGANNEYPLRAEYDFIRFYRWDLDTEYPCADMSADCLKDIDLDLTSNNACDGVPLIGDVAGCAQCGTTVRMACTETCQ